MWVLLQRILTFRCVFSNASRSQPVTADYLRQIHSCFCFLCFVSSEHWPLPTVFEIFHSGQCISQSFNVSTVRHKSSFAANCLMQE